MFSVIIPTRNRPDLFKRALDSVTAQTCREIEIIVVIDGGDSDTLTRYQAIIEASGMPVVLHVLPIYRNGHGGSYARNYGVLKSGGEYLCFLDDDDCWIDAGYLERVRETITSWRMRPELHLSNQAAFRGCVRVSDAIWIERLADALHQQGRVPFTGDTFEVSVKDMLSTRGFCHLNTLIVRRSLFDAAGALDETLRWEEDHDLYLRLIDRAESILYAAHIVARHNVPSPEDGASTTTSLSELERRVIQLRVFDKAALYAHRPEIRAYGRLYRGYTLKRIARILAADGDHITAYHYARTALGAAPTAKWAGYTLALAARAALGRRPKPQKSLAQP